MRKFTSATYRDHGIAMYRGNPLIEAIREIPSATTIVEELRRKSLYSPSERLLPPHQRIHALRSILLWREPLSTHVKLAENVFQAMMFGLVARNPLRMDYWKNVYDMAKYIGEFVQRYNDGLLTEPPQLSDVSTALNFAVIGETGCGKTCGIHMVFPLIGDIIHHSQYSGLEFPFIQIPYLFLSCPANGNLRQFLVSFFEEVDYQIGTGYAKEFAGRRATEASMAQDLVRVTAMHGIGIIFVDEIGNLVDASRKNRHKLLNTFVQLDNTLSLPLILIGTYRAVSVINSTGQTARRTAGLEPVIFDRLEEDTSETSDWSLYTDGLWKQRYIGKKQPEEMPTDIRTRLYYHGQGIPDLTVKIDILAQARSISTDDDQFRDNYSVELLDSVMLDLPFLTPMLEALRHGDKGALKLYKDFRDSIDIDLELMKALQKIKTVPYEVKESPPVLQPPAAELPAARATLKQEATATELSKISGSSKKHKPRKTQKVKQLVEGGILHVVAQAREEDIAPYEALERAGFIRGFEEFVEDN